MGNVYLFGLFSSCKGNEQEILKAYFVGYYSGYRNNYYRTKFFPNKTFWHKALMPGFNATISLRP